MRFDTFDIPEDLKDSFLTKNIAFFRNFEVTKSLRGYKSNGDVPLVFVFITKGMISLEINKTKFTAKKNDLLICPPNIVITNEKPSSNFDCKALALSRAFLLTIINRERIKWSRLINEDKGSQLVIPMNDEILSLVAIYEKLINARVNILKDYSYEDSISNITLALLSDLKCYSDSFSGVSGENKLPVRQSDVLFKKLIALVNDTMMSNQPPSRSINYYASQLNVSAKYLTHVCKICGGGTAKDLINSMLVRRIEYLLLHSDLSIKEIAMQLGFPDVSNFGRFVKGRVGASPRAIRAEAGK